MSVECVAGIQARLSSVRLPGKVLADLCGKPLIQRVYERTRAATLVERVFVLTSEDPSDDPLVEFLERAQIPYRRGSLSDVRSRYLDLVDELEPRFVVRVTGDCPFVEPGFIDQRVAAVRGRAADFAHVKNNEGGAVEGTLGGHDVFSARALRLSLSSGDARDAEHVASFFICGRPTCLRTIEIEVAEVYRRPGLRLQVDEPADLAFARSLWRAVDTGGDGLFPLERAIRWLDAQPEARAMNAQVRESADNQALRQLARSLERQP